jgi:hypothetical protein
MGAEPVLFLPNGDVLQAGNRLLLRRVEIAANASGVQATRKL